MLVLVFTSGAFVPLASMSGWLQAIGAHQPVTALASAERALVLGGPAAHHLAVCPAQVAGLLAVFTVTSARIYARMSR